MEVYKKISNYFKSLIYGKNKKKVMENTVIVIIIGVIIIIIGSTFFGKGSAKNNIQEVSTKADTEATAKSGNNSDYVENDKNYERILSQIEGAGKVSVLITYVSGKELVPATDVKRAENTTNEKDNGGGTRNITQNDLENKVVYSEEQGGVKKPVVIKEILPEVKGVVVVAEGASNIEVRESLTRAIQVLTGVATHKIQVFVKSK